jgi:hypothetical protein
MSNKKLVRDVLISIPLGLLYVFFINKIIEILTSNTIYEEKNKKIIAISFICVIIGYILTFKVFSNGKLKNRIVKYSLNIGTTIILINSIVYHWPELNNDTKTFMTGGLLMLIFILSYKL